MRSAIILALALTVALSACQKQEDLTSSKAAPTAANAPPTPPAPKATVADWRAAVEQSFTINNLTTDSGGVSDFGACFEGTKEKCTIKVLGSRDPFRKLRHFVPFQTKMAETLNKTYLGSYVALLDCDAPSLFLQPRFASKRSWIFMNAISIMADGELVFEKNFSDRKISRETTNPGVEEVYNFIASEEEVNSLRKVVSADSVIIRITGEKAYATVEKKDAEASKEDLAKMLKVFDKLDSATKSKIPDNCPV